MSAEPTQLEKAVAAAQALTDATRQARETLKDLEAYHKGMKDDLAQMLTIKESIQKQIDSVPDLLTESLTGLVQAGQKILNEVYEVARTDAESLALAKVQANFDNVNRILRVIARDAMAFLGAMDRDRARQVATAMSAFGPIVRDIETTGERQAGNGRPR